PTPSGTVTADLALVQAERFQLGELPSRRRNFACMLGTLRELNTLSLFRNQSTGHIPPQLGNLSALVQLNLRWNKFDGHIPPKLGNLRALEHLNLG
ncbi:unnamed protein product, partial [Ectocarpus sp. 6 AP-2014]